MNKSPETLVDRLRDIYPSKHGVVVTPRPSPICKEAADEIERLRAELSWYASRNQFEFARGDRVEKCTGDYKLEGIVVGVALTIAGNVRYVVEHRPLAPGMLHIYGAANLRRVSE